MDIIHYDEQLFLYLNNLGSKDFDTFWRVISYKWSWIPFYIFLMYLSYRCFGIRKLGYIIIFIVLGVLISDQVSGIFKYGFERLRPCHNERLKLYMRVVECGGKYGFYSSHASNSFFLATFLWYLFKKYFSYFVILMFSWACLVSYSRIYLGVHFPIDIVIGAFMGFIIGKVLWYLFNLEIFQIKQK